MKTLCIVIGLLAFGVLWTQDENCLFQIQSGNYVLEDEELVCSSGSCVNLNVDLQNVKRTNSYAVNSIAFEPPVSFNQNLQNHVTLTNDDRWSGVVEFRGRRDLNGNGTIETNEENVPYNFCFMGEIYSDAIIGSNGLISFDTSDANAYNSWIIPAGASLPSHQNGGWNDGNIFGACHDIDFSVGNSYNYLTWEVLGTYPCRYLVVKFQNVPHYQCNGRRTTQMMVLYENTNIIEVYIQSKPVCSTWNGGRAIIGIQNDAGTVAYSPEGRNPAFVQNLTNEAWQFAPNGSYTPNVEWVSETNGQELVIGTGANIQVCPEEEQNIIARVTYNTCGEAFEVEDEVTLRPVDIELPDEIGPLCEDSYTLSVPQYQGFQYQWTFNNNPIAGANSNSLTVSQSGTYGLNCEYNSPLVECEYSDQTQVILGQEPAVANIERTICDSDWNGVEVIDLTQYEDLLNIENAQYVSYHPTLNQAQNNTNNTLDPSDFQAAIGIHTIHLRVYDYDFCSSFATLTINVIPRGWAGEEGSLAICQSDEPINLWDFLQSEPQTGGSWSPPLASGSGVFDPMIDASGTYTYTITNTQPCADHSAQVEVVVNPMPILTPFTAEICDINFDEIYEFSLEDYLPDVLLEPEDALISFHETEAEAWSGENAIMQAGSMMLESALLPKVFYLRAVNPVTNCDNVSTIEIDAMDKLSLDSAPNLSQCADDLDDVYQEFDLTAVGMQMSSNENVSYQFYTSFEELANQQNPISNPESYTNTTPHSQTIWVRASLINRCDNFDSFEIIVHPLPYSETLESDTICAFNDSALLDAGDGFTGYQWYFEQNPIDGAIQSSYNATAPGEYSVLLSQQYEDGVVCMYEQNAIVSLYDTPYIADVQYHNGSITLIGSGEDPPFQYNVSDGVYQVNNTFYLPPGLYAFNILSAVGCEGIPIELPVLHIPNVFTPNGDGQNDQWRIRGLKYLNNSSISIFDRYGKQIKYLDVSNSEEFVWDGKYLGRSLPSTSYWFVIKFNTHAGTPHKFEGYVLLKNTQNN